MANSDKNIIREIAQNMDSGMDSYFNPTTNEIIAIPDLGQIDVQDLTVGIYSVQLFSDSQIITTRFMKK
ncbi:MAG: hypothetical protein GQ574_03525 [Crocinitomix sp.]|nr:hypothetical protein [Crocinitomix sp.]